MQGEDDCCKSREDVLRAEAGPMTSYDIGKERSNRGTENRQAQTNDRALYLKILYS